MKLGSRVKTEYGNGTVIGVEMFYDNGSSYISTDMDLRHTGARIIVDLDEGHTWPFKHTNTAYFYLRDLVIL